MTKRRASWSGEDDERLRAAVAVHGTKWAVISRSSFPCVTPNLLRMRWRRLRDASPPISRAASSALPVLPALSGCERPWPPRLAPVSGRIGRSRTGGRPWDYLVSRVPQPTRLLTSRQDALLRLWRLEPPSVPLYMCNLGRAEGIVQRFLRRANSTQGILTFPLSPEQRDRLCLAYYPGDVCHTLTTSFANLYWVGGTGGRRGFATRVEVSRFMGHDGVRCLPALQRLVPSDYTANGWIAESVHGRAAAECARVALLHTLSGSLLTAGSLYSGAFDALVTGFVECGVSLSREFVADIDSVKLSVLSASFAPRICFGSAEAAAAACPPVDVLTASPSCHEVSSARDLAEEPDLPASAVESFMAVVHAVVCRAVPRVIVLEQSNGLRTHHVALYRRVREFLLSLPYVWFHIESDAHTDLGASHYRARLYWVGVRVDVCSAV